MEQIFEYAFRIHNGHLITVVYGLKMNGRFGINVYRNIGEPPVQSGSILRSLRDIAQELQLNIPQFNILTDTTHQLGRKMITALNVM
jgi:hypothetical protein